MKSVCIIQNFWLNLKTNCCKDIGHTKKQVFILSYWNNSSANWTTNEKWRINEAICFSFISIILYKQSVLTSSCRKTISRKRYQYYFKIWKKCFYFLHNICFHKQDELLLRIIIKDHWKKKTVEIDNSNIDNSKDNSYFWNRQPLLLLSTTKQSYERK